MYELLRDAAIGSLSQRPNRLRFRDQFCQVTVGAAPGYPQSPKKNIPLSADLTPYSTDQNEPPFFFSGLRSSGKTQWVTSGGRVLGAIGRGTSLSQARESSLEKLRALSFEGMVYRSDIGIERSNEGG